MSSASRSPRRVRVKFGDREFLALPPKRSSTKMQKRTPAQQAMTVCAAAVKGLEKDRQPARFWKSCPKKMDGFVKATGPVTRKAFRELVDMVRADAGIRGAKSFSKLKKPPF